MKYPAILLGSRGFAAVVKSEKFWDSFMISFISIYTKRVAPVIIYSIDGTKYPLSSIEPREKISFFERLLGSARSICVEPIFGNSSEFNLDELKEELACAVRKDDDILCQHEDEETILVKLESCNSVAQVVQLLRWATKDFSKN